MTVLNDILVFSYRPNAEVNRACHCHPEYETYNSDFRFARWETEEQAIEYIAKMETELDYWGAPSDHPEPWQHAFITAEHFDQDCVVSSWSDRFQEFLREPTDCDLPEVIRKKVDARVEEIRAAREAARLAKEAEAYEKQAKKEQEERRQKKIQEAQKEREEYERLRAKYEK